MVFLAHVNKKVIIILIILIIIGIGGYMMMKKSPQSSNNQAPITQNKPTNETIQGSLKSLLSAGKSQKCTYSNKVETTSVEGTVYVADGKMRGDFTTTSEQTKMTGHMIVDGGYSYVWSDLSDQGIKMAIDNQQKPSNAPADNTNNQAPDMEQSYNYTCQGWAGDDTVFAPPNDITFASFTLPSTQPSGTSTTGINTNSSACSACDSVPAGAARDACKTQLNCQ